MSGCAGPRPSPREHTRPGLPDGRAGSLDDAGRSSRRTRRSDLPPRARRPSSVRGPQSNTNLGLYNGVGKIRTSARHEPSRMLFPVRLPPRAEAATLAPTSRRAAFPRLAKKILDDYWSFHPTTAAAFGIHRYDGMLPAYTAATLRAFTTRVRQYIDALDRLDHGDGLTRKVRLRLGVLRGLLLTELSEIEDQRLPNALPLYSLFRMNIVNYLLRNYAPLDRRVRAIGKLESQVPRFLKDLRSTLDRRLADTFFEVGEMAATGMLDAYARELPEVLAAFREVLDP